MNEREFAQVLQFLQRQMRELGLGDLGKVVLKP
jgi:hypothetical protein